MFKFLTSDYPIAITVILLIFAGAQTDLLNRNADPFFGQEHPHHARIGPHGIEQFHRFPLTFIAGKQ